MLELVTKDEELNYAVYNSSYIRENYNEIIEHAYFAHDKFNECFPEQSSTWTYRVYNIFSLSTTSLHFYNIYKEMVEVIKLYNGKEEPMWVESWMNFHKENEVLDWHDHRWDFHGYITIDPKDSNTIFEQYSVKNEIGNIYVGPGHRKHKVIVNKPYVGERITLGYDVTKVGNLKGNISLIPIL
jgi:hypothetical protein